MVSAMRPHIIELFLALRLFPEMAQATIVLRKQNNSTQIQIPYIIIPNLNIKMLML